jgi:hypothetical protein
MGLTDEELEVWVDEESKKPVSNKALSAKTSRNSLNIHRIKHSSNDTIPCPQCESLMGWGNELKTIMGNAQKHFKGKLCKPGKTTQSNCDLDKANCPQSLATPSIANYFSRQTRPPEQISVAPNLVSLKTADGKVKGSLLKEKAHKTAPYYKPQPYQYSCDWPNVFTLALRLPQTVPLAREDNLISRLVVLPKLDSDIEKEEVVNKSGHATFSTYSSTLEDLKLHV